MCQVPLTKMQNSQNITYCMMTFFKRQQYKKANQGLQEVRDGIGCNYKMMAQEVLESN